jgi:hypothetical protein
MQLMVPNGPDAWAAAAVHLHGLGQHLMRREAVTRTYRIHAQGRHQEAARGAAGASRHFLCRHSDC